MGNLGLYNCMQRNVGQDIVFKFPICYKIICTVDFHIGISKISIVSGRTVFLSFGTQIESRKNPIVAQTQLWKCKKLYTNQMQSTRKLHTVTHKLHMATGKLHTITHYYTKLNPN